jgi:hypothetical protein
MGNQLCCTGKQTFESSPIQSFRGNSNTRKEQRQKKFLEAYKISKNDSTGEIFDSPQTHHA